MAPPHALTCDATLANVPRLLAFVDEAAAAARVDEDTAFALRLAAEEVVVNVVRHGYAADPGPVGVSVRVADGACTLVVTDEAPLFDPASVAAPALGASVEDRPIGGLGWHLVYRVMDEVRHEAVPGGGNRVVLVKRLPAPPDPPSP